MTCDTGNCPECKIEIGGTPIMGIDGWTYHLFILYHDTSQSIIYRGGPGNGGVYGAAVSQGLATQYEAPTREHLDIDLPWGNLVTNRQVGMANNYDLQAWAENGSQADHLITIAEGAAYCGLDARFTEETRRIGELGRTYNAAAIDRTDNSNATVYTILDEMGLPRQKPDFIAPGWGTNLHEETTFPEEVIQGVEAVQQGVQQAVEPVRREMRWFHGLNPMDQANFLRQVLR